MIFLIYFLALVVALTAISKNGSDKQKPLARKPYIISVGLLLTPLFALVIYDIARLEMGTLPAFGESVKGTSKNPAYTLPNGLS